MRRFNFIVGVLLAVVLLPAALRCEIGAIAGLEIFGSQTPCAGKADNGCSDGCTILETGLIKISSDVKAPMPSETLLCECLICLSCAFAEPEPAADFVRRSAWSGSEHQRTWQFVQRAALPSRAPSA